MVRKTIAIILTVLLALPTILAPVLAMSGGETDQFYFSKCDLLTINITPYASEFVMDGCTNDFNGSFTCNCSNDYTFNLTSKSNAVGEFNVTLTNYYEPPEPVVVTDYTHMVGIGPIERKVEYVNVTETVIVDNPYIPQDVNDTIEELENTVIEQEEKIGELKETGAFRTLMLGIVVVAIIVIIIVLIIEGENRNLYNFRQKMNTKMI